MNLHLYFFWVLVSLLGLSACGQQSGQKNTSADGDLMLLYMESEPGIDPYRSRLLVGKNFLRMDDGKDSSDYTLLDRKKQIIYTINHDEETVMELKQVKTKNHITRKLILDAKKLHDINVPQVDGRSPVQYRLLVNNKACATIYAVKGLHPKAVAALREFKKILASIHLSNMKNTPVNMRDECFLAHEVLKPNRTLQYGLPVYEASAAGMKRILMDYKGSVKHKAKLYTLPENYRMINMAGMAVK